MAGATVLVGDIARPVATDSNGEFLLTGLVSGRYTCIVSFVGYRSYQGMVEVEDNHETDLLILLSSSVTAVAPITVTASRFEQEVFRSPADVSVTSTEQFNERGFSSTAEALREEPGIQVQKTTHGHGAPIIRGLIGRYVLLLYDGLRLNKPTFRLGGNQYLSTIDRESLERIEVVRGPSSVMYGSDAIGGTVNLIPRVPAASDSGFSLHPRAATRYSSADQGRSLHVSLDGGDARLATSVGATVKTIGDLRGGGSVGRQEPTGWEETDFQLRTTCRVSDRTRVNADYQAVRQNNVPRYDKYVDGSFFQYVYDPQDRDLLALTLYSEIESSPVRSLRTGLSYQREAEGVIEQRSGESNVVVSRDRVQTLGGYLQAAARPHVRHALTFGGEYYYDKLASARYEETAAGDMPLRPTYPDDSRYASFGLFAADEWSLSDRTRVAAGLRYSSVTVTSPLEAPFDGFDKSFRDLTGSLGVSCALSRDINLVASWSRGFRAPNFNDAVVLKYSSSGVDAPSPNLEAETCNNVELGLKVRSQKISGSLFAFYNRLCDLIDRRPGVYGGLPFYDENRNGVWDSTEFAVYQRFNVGTARMFGFEGDGEVRLFSHATVRANMFWTQGDNLEDNTPLSRIPPLSGMVATRITVRDNLWLEPYIRAAASQHRLSLRDIDDTRIGPGGTAGWVTLNLRGGWNGSHIRINVTFDNLTDRAYKEHGSGIHSPGRGVILALTYSS